MASAAPPSATTLAPLPPPQRIDVLDALRGLALFGVLMVNLLTGFRVSLFGYYFAPAALGAPRSALDATVETAVALLLEFKSFALFSLLFGAGLGVQRERAGAARASFARLTARRMAALLVIGLVHLVLVWNGDILTEYALLGPLVALALLTLSRRGVLLAALVCLAVYLANLPARLPLPWLAGPDLAAHARAAARAYGHGGFATELAFRVRELPLIATLLVWVAPRTLGLMLLGAWAWERGLFRAPDAHRSELRAVAAVGVGGGALVTCAHVTGVTPLGAIDWSAPGPRALAEAGTLALALGLASGLLLAWRSAGVRASLAWAAPVGRMALTNYLTQSLVLSAVFYGHGLGLFDRLGSALASLVGLGLYAAQSVASRWWLRRHAHGPVESLWRRASYGAPRVEPAGRVGTWRP